MNFNIFQLCTPAFVYFLLMLIIIIIDIFNLDYSSVIIKSIGTVVITFLLNLLCTKNLSIIAYIFVFYPLIVTSLSMLYILLNTNNLYKTTNTNEKK